MAEHRTRKNRETPHYNFLYSWQPAEPGVNREKKIDKKLRLSVADRPKKADLTANEPVGRNIKKDIVRSLIVISFILCVELVVYLGWKRFLS